MVSPDHCNTVGKLNKIIDLGYAEKIIQVAEALHEKKLAILPIFWQVTMS